MPSGINKMAYRISFGQRFVINIVKIGFIKMHMLARSYNHFFIFLKWSMAKKEVLKKKNSTHDFCQG
jgi:hypothetical protein